MKIAIVGGGISGLTSAWMLHCHHEVTVFEANNYVGGHTNTVSVDVGDRSVDIDTGFIVLNDRTYPNFRRILRALGVSTSPTEMSFSVQCLRSGLEYCGSNLNGLFAQRRNLIRPAFLRMVRDILRFNRIAIEDLPTLTNDETVDCYMRRRGLGDEFARHYLLPMGAAIWSCPTATFAEFPIRFIVEFYHHHGLLQIRDRPVWHVVNGGSHAYVREMTRPFRDRIRLSTPVRSVRRTANGVEILTDEASESFDHVILACHSDQSLGMLSEPDAVERDILSRMPYSPNTAVLHTDTSLLPKRQRAWAAWNYRLPVKAADRAMVTYNMSRLQHLAGPQTYCVTLNDTDAIDPAKEIARFRYDHPVYTVDRADAQARHQELIDRKSVSYCGAYWGNGFHEDGVNSALAVCRRFGIDEMPSAESTRAARATPAFAGVSTGIEPSLAEAS